jgi:large subunit ribosomal protein L34e
MTGKSFSSGGLRRLSMKVPGGRLRISNTRRKPSRPTCPITGQRLQGVPQTKRFKISKMSKSQKRPQRPYGGVLSSSAMRSLIIRKARETK